jgi:predicted nucleic acid-binding protein
MSAYLLDVNVLIASIDPLRVHHERAHAWFGARGRHE